MPSTETRSRSAMLKALLLVWLAGFIYLSPADAESQAPLHKGFGLDSASAYLLPGSPPIDLIESPTTSIFEMQFNDADAGAAYGFEAHRSRADLYTLAKLAVDELEFLAGIRFIWNQTEKKFDRWALKLKLKGDISLDGSGASSGRTATDSDVAAIHSLSARSDPSWPQLSFRSILMPKKIRWNFSFDPNDQVVFGELKWGSFLALQSDVGSHQEVKMVFQYAF